MLFWFVILYILFSVGIGLFVATKVKNTRDFAIAGRHLPLPVVIATVFATWFGAEAIFGVSSTFVEEGLTGVVADPFGASLCQEYFFQNIYINLISSPLVIFIENVTVDQSRCLLLWQLWCLIWVGLQHKLRRLV
jgi:Na+/proline symporter